jgi:hypothetical protein
VNDHSEFKFSIWSFLWLLLVVFGAVVEARSLKSKTDQAPLCAHVRWTFSMGDSRGKAALIRQAAGYGLWGWFLYHIAVPYSRKPRPWSLLRKMVTNDKRRVDRQGYM